MILSIEDLKEYRLITASSKCKDLEIYIKEAQEIDLKNFLGFKLYYDMIENIDQDNYKSLVYGSRYEDTSGAYTFTIDYRGLKPLMAYWAYARILDSHGYIISKTGVVEGEYDESVPLEKKDRDSLVVKNRGLADSYKAEVEHFLCEKDEDYPLWCGIPSNNRVSNFKFKAL